MDRSPPPPLDGDARRSAEPDRPEGADELVRALDVLDRFAREELLRLRRLAPEARLRRVLLPVEFHLEDGADVERRVQGLLGALRRELKESLLAAAAFERGRVFCLRCESSQCEHSLPPSERHVLAGYGQTGRPDWRRFDEFLTARGDPRIDRLFGRGRGMLCVVQTKEELYADVLPGFETVKERFLVIAQCCAGYFGVELPTGESPVAVTVQVVRTVDEEHQGVAGVHLLGRMPDGVDRPLEENALPGLADTLRPLRRELGAYAPGAKRARSVPSRGIALERLASRCVQLLRDVARDLEHRDRADRRRTRHARERVEQADRPTAKALEEASRTAPESTFEDRERSTVVVLGGRNRVHVFTLAGKHVTSATYTGAEIRQRIERRRWVPLGEEKFQRFRINLAAAASLSPEDAP